LEEFVWEQCLDLLRDPAQIFDPDLFIALHERDANREAEIKAVQKSLGECEVRKQFVVGQVTKRRLSPVEGESHMTEIEDNEIALRTELTRLEDGRSLAKAYEIRVKAAQALLRELGGRTDIESQEDRQRVVAALLGGITVTTERVGKRKRAKLTMRWLAEEPYTVDYDKGKNVTLDRLGHVTTPQAVMDESEPDSKPLCTPSDKVRRVPGPMNGCISAVRPTCRIVSCPTATASAIAK
jgi:hypothetical protein